MFIIVVYLQYQIKTKNIMNNLILTPKRITFEVNHVNALTGEHISFDNMTFEKAYKKLKKQLNTEFNIWNVIVKY